MPYRRRNYSRRPTYTRRRRYNNRRKRTYKRRNKPYTKIVKQPTGVPDRTITKLKYATFIQMSDLFGGVGAAYVFRANSIWDPDLSGTGALPVGHVEWSQFYNYYRVNGASISVRLAAIESQPLPGNVIVACNCATTPFVTPGVRDALTLIQEPNTVHRIITTNTGSQSTVLMKKYISMKKLFGRNDLSTDEFKALFTANPIDQAYFNLEAQALNGAATFTFQLLVTITYYVEFSERVVLQRYSTPPLAPAPSELASV